MSLINTDNQSTRTLLSEAFRQLHRIFANCVDVELIGEWLVKKTIISTDEWDALRQEQNAVERCGRLLALVDETAADDESFRQLRLAVKSEPSYAWIIDEPGDRHEILLRAQEARRQTRQAEAGKCI